jgi:hypothetical protein
VRARLYPSVRREFRARTVARRSDKGNDRDEATVSFETGIMVPDRLDDTTTVSSVIMLSSLASLRSLEDERMVSPKAVSSGSTMPPWILGSVGVRSEQVTRP